MPPVPDSPDAAPAAALAVLAGAGYGVGLTAAPDDPQDILLRFGRQRPRRYRLVHRADPITLAAVEPLRAAWQRDAEPPHLLLAPGMAPEVAQALVTARIPFIDAAGNAYIAGPGLLIRIAGRELPKELPVVKAPARLFTAKGLRVMFVLLAEPSYLDRPYRDIAAAAKVAVGTVAGVFEGLRTLGHLREGKRPYLVRRLDLITQWVNAYIQKNHYETKGKRFFAADAQWWRGIDIQRYDACFGGDVAADKLTGYLKPAQCTVHAFGDPALLKRDARMRADPQGDIVIIEAFWQFPAEKRSETAPPLLVYAELLATGDPRAIEVAGMIHERFLAGPDQQD